MASGPQLGDCGREGAVSTRKWARWQSHGGEGRVSPLWLRMWISRELALGQLLRHCGKGHTCSLGYASLGFSSEAAAGAPAPWRLAQ